MYNPAHPGRLALQQLPFFAVALLAGSGAAALQAPQWPDTYVARLQALALVQTLNADILANRSATQVLERWCRDHQLAADPVIRAQLQSGAPKPPSDEQMARLGVRDASEIKYRRVELRCGAHVLSKADNWYVPSRLTPEMNRLLESTDTPFGKAVASLQPYRQSIEARLLWAPLPADAGCAVDTQDSRHRELVIPSEILQHRAVLYTREHQPFSEVSEVYQAEILAFPFRACASCAAADLAQPQ